MATKRELQIDLGLVRIDHDERLRACLAITTEKCDSGGVETLAVVNWVAKGFYRHAHGLGYGGEFREIVHLDTNVRATQKAIDQQHDRVVTEELICVMRARAYAHYPGDVAVAS